MGFDPEPESDAAYSLADVFEKKEWRGKTMVTYEYDMGDSWEHGIFLFGRADAHLREHIGIKSGQRVFVVSGESHPCQEDCGGPPRWEDVKDQAKKAKGTRKLDPYKWDISTVNESLARVSKDELPDHIRIC